MSDYGSPNNPWWTTLNNFNQGDIIPPSGELNLIGTNGVTITSDGTVSIDGAAGVVNTSEVAVTVEGALTVSGTAGNFAINATGTGDIGLSGDVGTTETITGNYTLEVAGVLRFSNTGAYQAIQFVSEAGISFEGANGVSFTIPDSYVFNIATQQFGKAFNYSADSLTSVSTAFSITGSGTDQSSILSNGGLYINNTNANPIYIYNDGGSIDILASSLAWLRGATAKMSGTNSAEVRSSGTIQIVADTTVYLEGTSFTFETLAVIIHNMPTADPGVPGQLWRSGADVKISL